MTRNPFLTRVANRGKGHHGRKAEESLAKRIHGTAQPASGAKLDAKGDVVLTSQKVTMLMENKSTVNESFSVKLDHLLKIHQEALETSRIPALSFQFVSPTGKSDKRSRWVAITEEFFMELLEAYNDQAP